MKTKATVYLPGLNSRPIKDFETGKDNVSKIYINDFGSLEIVFNDYSWSAYGNMPFELHGSGSTINGQEIEE